MERGAAGEHREHDAQRRVRGRARTAHEGVPGGVHLGHVAGHRRPPRGIVELDVARARGGPSAGASRALEALERGAEGASRPAASTIAPVGHGEAARRRVQQALRRAAGSGSRARDRAPRREALGQLGDALAGRRRARMGLVGGQRLDAERQRGAEQGPVDVGRRRNCAHAAAGARLLAAARRANSGSPGELQRPGRGRGAPAAAPGPGRASAAEERLA